MRLPLPPWSGRPPTRPHNVFTIAIPWASAALLGFAPPALGAGPLAFPVVSKTLDNGLEVHVVPMDTAPGVAAVYTWMDVGSRDEIDEGRTGFAHFFEHLMFYGTETTDAEERDRHTLRMGVAENAWTWFDETVYHGVLPAQHLEAYLALEADRFQNLALTEEMVRKESGAVLGEYRKSVADPGFALDVAVQRTAFGTHPYGHDTIGLPDDIDAMPTAHAYASTFLARHYRPERATLLVVGNVDPAVVHPLVEGLYGGWEPAPEPPPEIPQEPEQTELRTAHVTWSGPTPARLVMAWKVPGHDATSAELAHLQLAGDLLLSPVGALQERLVRELGLAYTVWGGRDRLVDPGLFRVVVKARDPAHLPRIEQVIREEIAALQAGPGAEALEATRTHGRYRFLTSLDSPAAVADTVGWVLRRNDDISALSTWIDLLDAATPADVAAAASRTWVDARLTVVTLTADDVMPEGVGVPAGPWGTLPTDDAPPESTP